MTPRSWPSGAHVEPGAGALPRLLVDTPLARAEIYLLGANVTSWQPAGAEPVLWLSETSYFAPGKAIRGGVPICWPWFGPRAGDPVAPQHGFARTSLFALDDVSMEERGIVTVTMGLRPSRTVGWPHDAELSCVVRIGAELGLQLRTVNRGSAPLRIEEALHSYFAVSDVERIRVGGLEGTVYVDKADGGARKIEGTDPVALHAETDRVHLATRATCVIEDPGRRRRIVIEKSGSASTVLWNPWREKAARMADVGEGWRRMVCVETANALDDAVEIAPGAVHEVSARIRLEAA